MVKGKKGHARSSKKNARRGKADDSKNVNEMTTEHEAADSGASKGIIPPVSITDEMTIEHGGAEAGGSDASKDIILPGSITESPGTETTADNGGIKVGSEVRDNDGTEADDMGTSDNREGIAVASAHTETTKDNDIIEAAQDVSNNREGTHLTRAQSLPIKLTSKGQPNTKMNVMQVFNDAALRLVGASKNFKGTDVRHAPIEATNDGQLPAEGKLRKRSRGKEGGSAQAGYPQREQYEYTPEQRANNYDGGPSSSSGPANQQRRRKPSVGNKARATSAITLPRQIRTDTSRIDAPVLQGDVNTSNTSRRDTPVLQGDVKRDVKGAIPEAVIQRASVGGVWRSAIKYGFILLAAILITTLVPMLVPTLVPTLVPVLVEPLSIDLCQYKLFMLYFPACEPQQQPFQPVFRDLVSNTSLLIDTLLDLNTPGSSLLMDVRAIANMLVKAVQENSDRRDNAGAVENYLQRIGDTIYSAGSELEKTYNKGSWAFDALAREIESLGTRLSRGSELSRPDVEYVIERYRKVIDVIERLRKQFLNGVSESDTAARALTGEVQGLLQGLPDVIKYFDELDQHKSEFDLAALKRDVEHMKPAANAVRRTKNELSNAASSLEKRRQYLIKQRNYLNEYNRGNVSVTDTETESVMELVERLRYDRSKFVSKDESTNARV